MTESTEPQPGSAGASFAAHVQAFHAGLPPEEQALLEQVFALAASATAGQSDVHGFALPSTRPVSFASFDIFTTIGGASGHPLGGGGGAGKV